MKGLLVIFLILNVVFICCILKLSHEISEYEEIERLKNIEKREEK